MRDDDRDDWKPPSRSSPAIPENIVLVFLIFITVEADECDHGWYDQLIIVIRFMK